MRLNKESRKMEESEMEQVKKISILLLGLILLMMSCLPMATGESITTFGNNSPKLEYTLEFEEDKDLGLVSTGARHLSL